MLTSHELFGFMSPALANDILAFTFESDKPTYRAMLNAVAAGAQSPPGFSRTPAARPAPCPGDRHAGAARPRSGRRQPHPRLAGKKTRPCWWIFSTPSASPTTRASSRTCRRRWKMKAQGRHRDPAGQISARGRGRLSERLQRHERGALAQPENHARSRSALAARRAGLKRGCWPSPLSNNLVRLSLPDGYLPRVASLK